MNRIRLAAAGAVLLAAGFAAGILADGRGPASAPPVTAGPPSAQVWTCSMHPQVRLPGPGKCPICGMPLVPVGDDAPAGGGAPTLTLSEHAIAMAAIETSRVERRPLAHEIRAVGRIEPNETALTTVTTRVEGWIEKLYVDATGIGVAANDHLLELYSPELVSAQKELLIALEGAPNPALAAAGRARLLRWGMSAEQVEQVVKERRILETVTLHAPAAGTVLEKAAVKGAYVQRGDLLYRLANLESVWVYLDIYEFEISWIQPGESVDVVSEALPGRTFQGVVTFISPVLNEATRTVKVRVNLPNPDGLLRPGMFTSSTIRVRLTSDGRPAPTPAAGKWTCPMHPDVLAPAAGTCPRCGMALAQFPGAGQAPAEDELKVLAVPASAVLDSGTRRLVYVERGRGTFEQAEVVLGPRAGEWFPVASGLKEGDRVATRGGFLIDSQFQIRGLPSLISPGGGAAPRHEHGGGGPPPPDDGGMDHGEGSSHEGH